MVVKEEKETMEGGEAMFEQEPPGQLRDLKSVGKAKAGCGDDQADEWNSIAGMQCGEV